MSGSARYRAAPTILAVRCHGMPPLLSLGHRIRVKHANVEATPTHRPGLPSHAGLVPQSQIPSLDANIHSQAWSASEAGTRVTTPAQLFGQLQTLRAGLVTKLASADDAAFLRMLWALNALQTGRADDARRFLGPHPPDAETEGIFGPHAIYPWELETITNELLVAPKGRYQVLPCHNWNTIGQLVNQLRAVENAEYGARRGEVNILVEMGRIGARQFPWQRGHFGIPQLYRNAFVYGQGECSAYLLQSTGLTASDMTLVGFFLLSAFYREPAIRPAEHLDLLHEFGIERQALDAALNRIARPIVEVRREARELRKGDEPIAYRPSILRRFPCLRLGPRNRTLVAPLPDLIMDRVTNGLFYDVIGGGGPVRKEIGRRFETYALDLLRRMMRGTRFESEGSYRTDLGPISTPDVLMHGTDGSVRLAIECKASRMGVAARFGAAPEQDRGYEEIAKGVMQLWRYFGHCRRQVAPDRVAADACAMVLTMDEWFAGRSTVIPRIIARANELADASPHRVEAIDRRSVAFCTISELEAVLTTATQASLLEAVRIGSGDKAGWIFSILHAEAEVPKEAPREYAFNDELPALLPWYARLCEHFGDEADEQP